MLENKFYQELLIDLFTACLNTYSGVNDKEIFDERISLLRAASDISADIRENLNSVLSMMILSLEINPELSANDRVSFVYGMSAANRDGRVINFNDKEQVQESFLKFQGTDEHFNFYDINQASLGYKKLVSWQLQPKFLEKK